MEDILSIVIDQFSLSGFSNPQISYGVEEDIFVDSDGITAMIDIDGEVALAIPQKKGGRRYLDVKPDEISNLLTTNDVSL